MATSSGQKICECEDDFSSLIVQFFEMVPIRRMQWKGEKISSSQLVVECQRHVLIKTVQSETCCRYPPALSYRKAFMKKLLHTLEDFDVEICDEVYEVYTELLQQVETEEDALCYKTYTLDPSTKVTLQESVNMISFGTTGLSTWQAAQHLAEWTLENKHLLEGKNVLELGSGLGLTGIVVCKMCNVKSYTYTDCSPQVNYLLARNIKLNFYNKSSQETKLHRDDSVEEESQKDTGVLKQIRRQLSLKMDSSDSSELELFESTNSESVDFCGCEDEEALSSLDLRLSPRFWEKLEDCDMSECRFCEGIRVGSLDWEDPDENLIKRLADTEVILAADVVYDKRIIPALVSVLKRLLCSRSSRDQPLCAYVTSTIRFEDTRDQFLIAMSAEGLQYELVESPARHLFHYDRSVPIEILKITASK